MNISKATRYLQRSGIGLILFLISSLIYGADLPMAEPESVGISSERLQRVDDYFQRFVDEGEIAGAVSLVARKGKVVHHSAVGWKYRE